MKVDQAGRPLRPARLNIMEGLTLVSRGGGALWPPYRFFLCFIKAVSSREMKLSDFQGSVIFTGRGFLKIGGIRYFFLDQKGDQKTFFKLKRGSLTIFKQ